MSNPAPGALETVRAFVNTRDVDEAIEQLEQPADLARWLAEHDLLGGAASVRATAADLRHATPPRGAPLPPLPAPPGGSVGPAAAAVLDAAARRARLTLRFTGAEATALEPAAGGVD